MPANGGRGGVQVGMRLRGWLKVAAEQGCAPGSDGEQGSEEDDGVDAFTSLAGPVGGGVEIEPDGELIEGEGGAGSVGEGEQAAEENRQRGIAVGDLGELSVAGDEQQEDSPNKVMNVAPAHLDIAERADVMSDGGDQQAHPEEGDEEADRGEKEAALRTIGNLLMDDESEFGEVQQKENESGGHDDESEQNDGTGDVHGWVSLPRLKSFRCRPDGELEFERVLKPGAWAEHLCKEGRLFSQIIYFCNKPLGKTTT